MIYSVSDQKSDLFNMGMKYSCRDKFLLSENFVVTV